MLFFNLMPCPQRISCCARPPKKYRRTAFVLIFCPAICYTLFHSQFNYRGAAAAIAAAAPQGGEMLFNNFKRDIAPYVFAMFAIIGGFLEAFTFTLHGGVFCNAQTGNVVMLVIDFVNGDFSGGLRYLYSILAYIVGIILSTVIPARFKKVNWPLVVTATEIVALVGIAFIPVGASDWFTYVAVAFLCSVQYNTFTKLRGVALATTFCTNNIRQTVMHLVRGISDKDGAEYKKSAVYAFIVLCFAAGAAVGAVAAGAMGNWCILICAALIVPVLALFIADSSVSVKKRRAADCGGKAAAGEPVQLTIEGFGGEKND